MAAPGISEAPSVHHLMPSVPPPPIPSPLREQRLRRLQQEQQQEHREQQQQQQQLGHQLDRQLEHLQQLQLQAQRQPPPPLQGPAGRVTASISRYRTLRGKSVSSLHRSKTFDVFVDADEAPPTPSPVLSPVPVPVPVRASVLRRRSKSAVSSSASIGQAIGQAISSPGRSVQQLSPSPAPTVAVPASPITSPPTVHAATTNGNPDDSPKVDANVNANVTAAANAAANPTPLSSKSVNTSLQPSNNLKAKLENTRPADLARLKAITPNQKENRQSPARNSTLKFKEPQGHPAIVNQQDTEAEHWAEEVARLEAETDRILAEQKKRDLARLQAQLATATPKSKPRRLILDKLTLFTKGSRSNANAGGSSGSSSPNPSTPSRGSSPRTFPLVWSPGTTNFDGSPSSDTTSMAYFDYGGAGALSAQMDAPTSASNGGERRITVRCQSATINLPVTPETSPADIIYSTANFITQKVEPANCILVECYVMCGLERRLRKYERIRDVMNSWDRDQQNSLMVLPLDSTPDDRAYDLAHVPKTEDPPIGFTFQLYHASKPGKWNKRWVTLMDTGQMFAAKRPDSKFTDKDGTTLCHLSDFDIYTPRESEMRRHLKPPKKFCYAIKSQQKSNAFVNGENFIHFFCTDDHKLAHRFHELIHGWRSWYLANKKVDLVEKAAQTIKKSLSISHKSHKSKPSLDEKPYTIGEFKPLIDMERFDKPIEEFGKDLPVEEPPPPPQPEPQPKEGSPKPRRARSKAPPRNRAAPSLPTSPVSNEGEGDGDGEFLSGGLLGDAYDKRKQAEAAPAVTTEVKKIEGPFTEGPSLLNGMMNAAKPAAPAPKKPEPASWFPSATEHTARARSTSAPRHAQQHRRPVTADNSLRQKHQQQPFLPPAGYPPPPGRAGPRSGRGHGVKPPPNGTPLIDLANGNPMPSGPMPSRSASRAAPPGGGGLVNQPRRRATTASSRSGAGGYIPTDRPPVPPLPDRSTRRPDHRMVSPPTHSRDHRPAEPLINRAK